LDKIELQKVERYLRRTLNSATLRVMPRPKKKDSAEIYVGEEFVGILSLDDEDGDRSYIFTMSILDSDVE
jgi:hypothetical protein